MSRLMAWRDTRRIFEGSPIRVPELDPSADQRHTLTTRDGDMDIDELSFVEHLSVQIKQRERVGREEIDKFETAIERGGKDAGYVIAFSFTDGARKEAARAHR